MSFKIAVFKMVDLEFLGDTSHTSISGGIATHDLYEVGVHYVHSCEEILPKIKDVYGCTPYIFDDRLEFQESDSETLSFYLSEIEETSYDNSSLKQFFPELGEG